jgi:hypothetical protein
MNTYEESEAESTYSAYCLRYLQKISGSIKWRYKAILLLSVLLFTLFHVWAQNAYAVHANIIYRFTKYINWPDDKKTGDFVIGVIGDTPLYDELKIFISNKTASGQPFVIKKYSSTSSSFNCHILFISDDESENFKRIAANTAGTSTLLVTESEGLSRKGSCINFVIVEDRLKLEINKSNIERRSLDIASELLNLGIIVK